MMSSAMLAVQVSVAAADETAVISNRTQSLVLLPISPFGLLPTTCVVVRTSA